MSGAPDKAAEGQIEFDVEVDESLSGGEQIKIDAGDKPEPKEAAEENDRLEMEQRPDEGDDDGEEGDSKLSNAERKKRYNARKAAERIRRREMLAAMEAQIRAQNHVIEQLQQQVGQTVGQTVETQYRNAMDHVRRAEQAMQEAVERGDGAEHVKALRYRDEALAAARQLAPKVEQIRREGVKPPQQQMRPDPELMRRTAEWAQKNPWFKADGSDADSAIVKAIDNEVAAQGYDPRTSDYWDELNERLREKLPHRFKVGERKAPAIGGRGEPSQTGGKVTLRISPEMKANMIEAGVWDDPKRRAKVLADHFRILNASR